MRIEPSASKTLRGIFVCFILLWVVALPAGRSFAQDFGISVFASHGTAIEKTVFESFRQTVFVEYPGIHWDINLLDNPVDNAARYHSHLDHRQTRLILTLGSEATSAMGSEEEELPIVAGLVFENDQLRQSENMTGVVLEFSLDTQFQHIRRLCRESRNVGVVYSAEKNADLIGRARKVAETAELRIVPQEVNTPQEIPAALTLLENSADILWVVPDLVALNPRTVKYILLFSHRNRIPLVGLSEAWVKAGALFALERDYIDMGKQLGEIAIKILKGSKTTDIQVEAPRKVRYAVNLKTAEHLRLEIPADFLEADTIVCK
jgi:putative ABC transport system substrate-binding protein